MKIRHTQGPDQIELGNITFVRGEFQEVSDELAAQALLPQRVEEYGFEPQPDPTRAGRKPSEDSPVIPAKAGTTEHNEKE